MPRVDGVVAGTGRLLEGLGSFRFGDEQLRFLSDTGVVNRATLDYLADFRFTGSISGYAEGEAYFPSSPLLVVEARTSFSSTGSPVAALLGGARLLTLTYNGDLLWNPRSDLTTTTSFGTQITSDQRDLLGRHRW